MTTLEAPAATITEADLARPLRIFQNRPTVGVPFWRWECRACGDSGGGGSHPDAVGRALTHCVEHPSHPSSLVPPVNCRQDDPAAPLRTIYEWLVARSTLEPPDDDPLLALTALADGTPVPADRDGSAGLAPPDHEFTALASADGGLAALTAGPRASEEGGDSSRASADGGLAQSSSHGGFRPPTSVDGEFFAQRSANGEFAEFGPLDGDYAVFASADGEYGDYAVFASADGEYAGFRPLDGDVAALPAPDPDLADLEFRDDQFGGDLDGDFDGGSAGEFAGDGAAVQRRLADGWSRALPVTWPPTDLFEAPESWDEPQETAELDGRAASDELGAGPPPTGGESWSTGGATVAETGDDAGVAVIGGATADREPVPGPMLPSRRSLPPIAETLSAEEPDGSPGVTDEGPQPITEPVGFVAQDAVSQDAVSQDAVSQDGAEQNVAAQDGAEQNVAAQDGAEQNMAAQDGAEQNMAAQDGATADLYPHGEAPDAPLTQRELPGLTTYAH